MRPVLQFPEPVSTLPYEVVRPQLDVFVVTWVGDSLLSRAIKRFAPGGSHSSLGLRIYGSIMLVEALEWGIDLKRASDRFDDYNGDILVHRIPADQATSDAVKETALKMVAQRDKLRYGYKSLFLRALGPFRNVMRRPICSQTVAYILAKHGLLAPQENVISPGELRCLLPRPWKLAPYSKEAD